MMEIINCSRQEKVAINRNVGNAENITLAVRSIMDDVKKNGDNAIRRYGRQFDGVTLESLSVSENEYSQATPIDSKLMTGINTAINNVRMFHMAQVPANNIVETMPGIVCWRKPVPIGSVGLYVPGGSAPLFSTLIMLAVPALIAGCREIVVCTPPMSDGRVHSTILWTAKILGLKNLFKIGGAQAIAAMAYGTGTVPGVNKIFGPGNKFVMEAKMQANASGIAIDMPAGPSELAILADDHCIPEYVAADLLSQAEHGRDSQVLLVCSDINVIDEVIACINQQVLKLSRKAIIMTALQNSKAILVSNMQHGISLINDYAPEHLIIACRNADELAAQVTNAGSVFIGNYAPESAGDYASGTNHVLPTGGFAKSYSGVSLDSFYKKITFQKLTLPGLESISDAIMAMAMAEGLDGHANAVSVRKNIKR